MGSDTERLEMLIVLHICLFLMSHDINNMSLGDNRIVQSVREMYCDLSLSKFDF